MTVYVDDMGVPATVQDGRRSYTAKWSHLFCDGDLDELHRFARSIGMQRRWFQAQPEHRYPHYDLVAWRRLAALKAGAVPVAYRDAPAIMRAAFPIEDWKAMKKAVA